MYISDKTGFCFEGEASLCSVNSGGTLSLSARTVSKIIIHYVPTRLEDIQELEQNLTIDGQEYCDKLRFCAGDTPARALEAGHQCNGRHTT